MNQKLWTKVLASLLVMTLTCANFILLGVYASNSYATTDNLEKQETTTNNANVEFDAYFKNEEGNTTHTTKESLEKQDMKLFLSVNVKKGYLKNAKVQVLGENNTSSNLKLNSSNETLELIEKIDGASNSILLKQLNGGTGVVLEVPVTASKENPFDITNFSKVNDIVLTANYVADDGKETKIQKTIQTRNEWTQNAVAVLEQQVVRFIPYQVGDKTGTILQTLVKSGLENNTLPIEETVVCIEVPKVNGKNPKVVNVTANGTMATNGKNVTQLEQENWNYDDQNGIVSIKVKNEPQENKVAWAKDLKDEYVLTYVFEEKVEALTATQNSTVDIKAYNSVATNVQAENELAIEVTEKLGEIVTGTLNTTDAISKGYLYTKAQKETLYEETLKMDIAYPELVDGLTLTQDMDYFVDGKGEVSPTTISDLNYAYYKTTKISKENFEKILGTDGYIKITSADGTELTTINNTIKADENGDYVFSYEGEINQIKIQTSKPINVGKLELRHVKALRGNTDYSKAQVEKFVALKTNAKIEATAGEIVISEVELAKDINLVAPSTKIEASVSNSNLSTVVKNENVEFRVILKTNDISCDLYKNPVVEIILPSYIEKLDIKDVNLLFDDQLTVTEYDTYVNENGNTVIKVIIGGEQTTYSQDQITKGANLVINTDITLKKLTPTKEDVMKVYVTNENVTTYENTDTAKTNTKGYTQTSLKAVAPVGVVTTNSISGYNSKNETVTSISGQEQVGKLDAKKEALTANVQMSVINNYQNIINQVSILGRIPTTGNKNVDTNEDFTSNIGMQLASAIQASGIDSSNIEIYYSENLDATKDVTLSANGWTKDTTNLTNMKSYLIVVNQDVATGTTLSFSYSIAIPENLSYNMQAYTNYVVYFNNVKQDETISEKAVATKVGLATGEGPELEVKITSDMEGKDVEEGKIITYKVSAKNIGKKEVNNVTLSGNVPEKTVYIYYDGVEGTQENLDKMYDETKKEYIAQIESLKPGETKEITYQVETKDLNISHDGEGNETVEEATIEAKAKANVEGYDSQFTSNTITNKLVQGYLDVSLKTTPIDASIVRKEGDIVGYELVIRNVNSKAKQNVIVTTKLPNGLDFEQVDNPGVYNKETNTVTWNIGTIEEFDIVYLYFEGRVAKLQDNTSEKITTNFNIKTTDKELNKSLDIIVAAPKLLISQSSETKQQVEEGELIVYNITVKNVGSGAAKDIRVVDAIPEGLTLQDSQYSIGDKTYDITGGDREYTLYIPTLQAKETIEIMLNAKADKLASGEEKKIVSNVAKIITSEGEEIVSNSITHTIVPSSTNIDDPSVDKPEEGTHKISGIAWLDSNKDGKEKKMKSLLEVLMLY